MITDTDLQAIHKFIVDNITDGNPLDGDEVEQVKEYLLKNNGVE